MRPFAYQRVADPAAAVAAATQPPPAPPRNSETTAAATVLSGAAPGTPPTEASAQYLAGGTSLLDLMKLDVMRPALLVDINPLQPASSSGAGNAVPEDAVHAGPDGLRLHALTRMSQAADHPAVRRDYPVVAETLNLAASAQLRNMASLGGNLLQRTRCMYFRDTAYLACNKRTPGSGCEAMQGVNRQHAVLGTSRSCIATYPGDFAQALIALDATLDIAGPNGATRTLRVAELHRQPGDAPHVETTLAPGELITAIRVPAGPYTRRSTYVKVRDRASYQFALASAAVALDLRGHVVQDARIALGGVATVPWRASAAEAALKGKPLDEASANAAAEAAFAGARPLEHNAFKVTLGRQVLVRALLQAQRMEA